MSLILKKNQTALQELPSRLEMSRLLLKSMRVLSSSPLFRVRRTGDEVARGAMDQFKQLRLMIILVKANEGWIFLFFFDIHFFFFLYDYCSVFGFLSLLLTGCLSQTWISIFIEV